MHPLTVILIPIPSPQNSYRFKVQTQDRELLGFLSKMTDSHTDTYPWQAYAPRFVPGHHAQFGDYLGSYFTGRHAAIAALVAANYGKPRQFHIAA
jgi:hypothetical protein